jgi:hypothetical protein
MGEIPFHVEGDAVVEMKVAKLGPMPAPAGEWVIDEGEVRAGFGWAWPNMPPGRVAELRRLDAIERHEAEEERARRAERADERWQAWLMKRAAELSWAGIPYDIRNPSSMMETGDQLAERVFAALEREDQRNEVRQKIASGEWRVIGHLEPSDSSPTAARSASGAEDLRGSTPGVPVSAVKRRIGDFFATLRHGSGCTCQACVRHRVSRKGARP